MMTGRIKGRTLVILVAVLVFVIALLTFGSTRFPTKGSLSDRDHEPSSQQECAPITREGAKVGTFCVTIAGSSDQQIVNRISLNNDFMISSGWKLKTPLLWMGPYEVSHLPANYEDVPYSRIDQEQSTMLQFANVSVVNHLYFDCSSSRSGKYVSKAIVVLGNKGSAQNSTKLEVEVSFELLCAEEGENSSGARINLRLADIQRKFRTQQEASGQHRRTPWSLGTFLLPQVDYDENGLPSMEWMKLRRNEQCYRKPLPTLRSESELLNEDFLRKAYITNYLAGSVGYERDLIANLDKIQQVYDHFYAWDDDIYDVTVIVKIEDTCYAAFRATDPFNFLDGVVQNLDCCANKIPNSNCFIRDGYYTGYFTDYVEEFEEKRNYDLRYCPVDACLASCQGEPCELVFTGGSQGAGPATVASIVHKHRNPKVITWGGVRALYRISPEYNSLCNAVNPRNHYRLILTDKLGLIDFIPYQWAFFAEHIGHKIFYDSDGFNYLGINNRIKRNPLRYNLAVHAPCNYVEKTKQLYENVCFPSASYGWLDGHWCADDDDCESHLCQKGTCFAGLGIGERCGRDKECLSGICNPNVEECAPVNGKMEEGMHCAEDEDCATERCDPAGWLPFSQDTCQAQLGTGEKCNEDSDCQFGYCGGFLLRRRCWPDDGMGSQDPRAPPEATQNPT